MVITNLKIHIFKRYGRCLYHDCIINALWRKFALWNRFVTVLMSKELISYLEKNLPEVYHEETFIARFFDCLFDKTDFPPLGAAQISSIVNVRKN